MPPLLTTRILTAIDQVSPAAWNSVVGAGHPPVVRWEWIHALEASGSATEDTGWAPHHLTLWRGDQLVGLAPAWRKFHSMGEYVYDFGWANAAQSMGLSYYPKLLVGVPLSPLTAPRFFAAPSESLDDVRTRLMSLALETAKDTGCSSVHVIFPTDDEATALEAAGLLRRGSLQYHWKNPGYASYDDYLSRFDSKRRNQLKRERAAAAGQGIVLRTVRSADLDKTHAQLAWRFYEATAKRHAWGPIQLNRDFFHRAFATLSDSIELVVAEKEGRAGEDREAREGGHVVAGAFNLHTRTRLYGRYWGCFEEHPFLHFNVCLYHSVDDCIRAGRQVFEPGAGGEHKISRGFEPTRIHSVHRIFNAKLERAIGEFCKREMDEVQRLAAESERISGLKPWPVR